MTGVISSTLDPSIYGAVAGVAAITTALHSLIALQPLRSAIDTRRRKRSSSPGYAPYNDAKHDARRDFFVYLLLNIVAAAIHGSVLAAWWKVGVASATPSQWEYWLPWLAVTLGSAALFLTSVGSIVRLGILAWGR